MSNIRCCYKCQEKYLGCHANCETYLGEKEEYEKEKQKILQAKELSYALTSMSIARNNKGRKRM